MDIIVAAIETRKLFEGLACAKAPCRSEDGIGRSHAVWMLDQIIYGDITGEQAHRWLGHVQSIIVNQGIGSLDSVKHINNKLA